LLTGVLAGMVFLGCVYWAIAASNASAWSGLTVVLAATGALAGILAGRLENTLWASGAFLAGLVAAAFGGPTSAFAVATSSEVVAWAAERYRITAMAINLASSVAPTMVAAVLIPAPSSGAEFYVVLLAASVGVILVNTASVAAFRALWDGGPVWSRLRDITGVFSLPVAINVGLCVAAAGIYRQAGLAAVGFAVLAVLAFTYMTRLLADARDRTRQYAALSWGVLSGLVRTLDIRDPRASRHSAAVAAYARDIARAAGMNDHDAELVHTAGLLHDIGRFALSDRVMERGRPLTNEDWAAIRRHPELGADMLRDLGLYGPVAEIVHAHHERIDGRGYPRRLKGGEIPELARIISVAEVYDTLTADDTYRTPISSFEALTELRRVAGTQLDAGYVETLSEMLAGRGVEYRHAREASFERELDLERRIGEAATS
jgi:putative nucleotidyltransferase with HDIG domain